MNISKVWFVTGASSGFGRRWTEAALERGDNVVATARNVSDLDDLVEKFPTTVLALKLDVTNRESVFAAVSKGHEYFGRMDVILCNAGYSYACAVEEINPEEAKANFETNVFGTLSVIQAALPILRKQRSGHIITLSSIGGVASFPLGGIYVATKFAIEALTEALAGEAASFGIKVTMIEPGSYSTGFGAAKIKANEMPEYEELRKASASSFKPELTGDPAATVPAILRIVDSEQPPLRLFLGNWQLPLIEKVYSERLRSWKEWAQVSNAAQGNKK